MSDPSSRDIGLAREKKPQDALFNPFVTRKCKGSKLLTKKFNEYNRAYFKGALPKFSVLLCSKPKDFGHLVAGYCFPKGRKILIRKGLGEQSTLQTLVHEMIHAKLSSRENSLKNKVAHGEPFLKELKRLRGLGAPLSPLELDKQTGQRTTPITDRNVRKLVREAKTEEKLSKKHVPKFLERQLELPVPVIAEGVRLEQIIEDVYA
jgi:hypothetical protein